MQQNTHRIGLDDWRWAVLTATSPQIWFNEDWSRDTPKEAPASCIIYISLSGGIFSVLWSVFPHLIWQKPGSLSTCLYQLWEPTKNWKCEEFPLRHFNPEDWLFWFLLLGWSFFRWHDPFEMDIWLFPELNLVWCKLFGSWCYISSYSKSPRSTAREYRSVADGWRQPLEAQSQ